MATSVHIPKPLLEAVDRRARALRVSRNQLIVRALEREMNQRTEWSPGFLEELLAVDASTAREAGEMLVAIRARRTAKEPRRL
jgi:metal-responsive CopG/Arc/MetJ family transcriptional regulator